MASKRPSLLELTQQSTSRRDDVVTLRSDDVPSISLAKARASLPHMSLYIGKTVQREIKTIALDYDRRPHDVLLEAVDLVLAKYGRPSISELSKRD